MTNKKILEGNKLIARFMGFTLKRYKGRAFRWGGELVYSNSIPLVIHGGLTSRAVFTMTGDTMDFHLSWDWLMPVLIKVVSDKNYLKFRDNCDIYMEGNPLMLFSTTYVCDVFFNFEDLYKECVEFIRWYNKNK